MQPEDISMTREHPSRECTHWHPIQDPADLNTNASPEIPVKKLTASQLAALALLANGKADFHAVIKAGANLSSMSVLVRAGLAAATQVAGAKQWEITDFGLTVLQSVKK